MVRGDLARWYLLDAFRRQPVRGAVADGQRQVREGRNARDRATR
jgi:hypothetical protein